jgi:hypothetical protein
MLYGLALTVFGEDAVKSVLRRPQWREKYRGLLVAAETMEAKAFGTPLPGEVVFEIAGREECLHDFYADLDGIHLYAVPRKRQWADPSVAEVSGKKLSAQDALLTYGALSLFSAVDKGSGLKDEK